LRVAVLLEVVVVHLQIVVLDEIIVEFVVVIVAEFVVVELVLVELLVVLELVVADRLDILFAEDVELVVPVALLALHVHPSELERSVTPLTRAPLWMRWMHDPPWRFVLRRLRLWPESTRSIRSTPGGSTGKRKLFRHPDGLREASVGISLGTGVRATCEAPVNSGSLGAQRSYRRGRGGGRAGKAAAGGAG